jgi:hypothetical protein
LSEDLDLIVRISDTGEFIGFELCHDKLWQERARSWSASGGFNHMAVDSGESRPGKYKETPILVPDGTCGMGHVYSAFLDASRSLPADVAGFVLGVLDQHTGFARGV